MLRRGGVPEQQWYAPRRRKRHQNIDDTADNSALSAEEPRHEVKAENPYKTPVQPADYHQR